MFNYTVNWAKMIMENLPVMLRTPFRYSRIRPAIQPVIEMYNEFIAFIEQSRYQASYNGGIISLEQALNDRFDTNSRRIYVKNAFSEEVLVYGKTELKVDPVIYSRWDSTNIYQADTYVWHLGKIYKSTVLHGGQNPVSGVAGVWVLQPNLKAPVVRPKADYSGALFFYVFVPSALAFSEAEMKSLINYYILTGLKYEIVTF